MPIEFPNPPPLPLNFVQDTLFFHTFDLWQVRRYGGKNPSANEYELFARNVRGLLTDDDRPADVGDLYKAESSTGQIGLSEEQVIDIDWVLVNKTINFSGNKHPEYGECYIVTAHPHRISSAEGRPIGTTICPVTRMSHKPKTIKIETQES